MDPRFQSSFIPKKPIDLNQRQHKPINLLSLIVTIVLIAVLAAAGGVFLYQNYLNGRIADDQKSLNLTQGQFDTTTINQLIRLDSRINVAKELLSGHIEFSNIFTLLEQDTIQTVRFSSFNLSSGDQGVLNLTMNGEALSFSDVAVQTAVFEKSSYIKNLQVGGLSVEPSGAVTFTMNMTIVPSLVKYSPTTVTLDSAGSVSAVSASAVIGAPAASTTSVILPPATTTPAASSTAPAAATTTKPAAAATSTAAKTTKP